MRGSNKMNNQEKPVYIMNKIAEDCAKGLYNDKFSQFRTIRGRGDFRLTSVGAAWYNLYIVSPTEGFKIFFRAFMRVYFCVSRVHEREKSEEQNPNGEVIL